MYFGSDEVDVDLPGERAPLDAAAVRRLVLGAGADDMGLVGIDRPELDDQRDEILSAFPRTKTLISFVCRMNHDAIRTPSRSIANLEFHHTGDHVDAVSRQVLATLRSRGVRGLSPSMGFPMEMERFPGRIWVVSHKPVAVAAGLGVMGIHRNVIHPKLGNFILLGTILTDLEIAEESKAIDFNPCLECKLCVAACPTGAIGADGHFNFGACYTHNYREFMGGFTDFVETVADSRDARDYRSRVTDAESTSWWQSLSYGANYKAAYCMAVCPAGDDIIGEYSGAKKQFKKDVLRPLKDKAEQVYVIPGSDAEAVVAKRFPNKTVRYVGNGLRPTSVAGFLRGLPLVFQPGVSKTMDATYHFTFTGEEARTATVVIRRGKLTIKEGLHGEPGVHIVADGTAWLDYLAKNRGMLGALLTRKIRIKGTLSLMKEFARCFPS